MHSISACAEAIINETDLTNNAFVYGVVTITFPYDINGDDFVGIDDIVLVIEHFANHHSELCMHEKLICHFPRPFRVD